MAARLELACDADRQSGLADATFELTDGDDPSHLPRKPDVCRGTLVVKSEISSFISVA
jgi:hypothetical protein